MGSDKKECSHFLKIKRQDRREEKEEDKNDKTEEKKMRQIRMTEGQLYGPDMKEEKVCKQEEQLDTKTKMTYL